MKISSRDQGRPAHLGFGQRAFARASNYEKDAPRADHHERSFSAYIIALDREMVS